MHQTVNRGLAVFFTLFLCSAGLAEPKDALVRVLIQTERGDIEVELEPAKAPVTTANFLKYVDDKFYDGGMFHRTVKPDNQPDNKVKIEVIQAGIPAAKEKDQFPPIKLERTSQTKLSHKDGTLSMARDGPDTATSDFFVCIGDQPELDFGGKRNPDGQGFAAFGRVVKGMEVVQKIQAAPADGQKLTPPVKIVRVTRIRAEQTPARRPPNVVLIFTDDQGYGDVGCFGAKGFETPNLDRMAREGIRLTNFYVAQAVCSASRTALLTGCYPNRLGILGALGPANQHGIHDRERTIAQVLKPRGYATAIYGKWHLGHLPPFLPTRHGFDDYFGLPYSNDMWPSHPTSNFPDLPLVEGEKTIAANPDQNQLTTWYTERAVKFIERNKDRPFFLYLAHNMPHVPLHVSNKFKGKSQRGLYGDVLMEIDWSVGQVLDALKKHGLDEQTLVLFTTDNGPWLSYGDHAGSAGPLREGKGTAWEGGVRVPFLARWPGKVPAGAVCHEPAMTIDVLPTLARLAGTELPPLKIDGLDVWPLLSGQPGAKSPQEAYYFFWGRELHAVRSGKWKLHFPHDYITLAGKPGSTGQPVAYRLARTELALYDLEADVGETKNMADRHPDVVARLKALADKAREDLGDALTRQQGKGVRLPGRVE